MLLEEYTCPSTAARTSLRLLSTGHFRVATVGGSTNWAVECTDEALARAVFLREIQLLKDAVIENSYGYLPFGENQRTFEGDYTAPQCPPHVPIEVGFRHSKIVCKICDKELASEQV